MEVVTANFSIREYAEGMRSIDLSRCWPFDYVSEGRSTLPLIKIQKFRWWADELDAARFVDLVDIENDQIKDDAVTASFEAEGDEILQRVQAVDEGRRSVKGKQRTKKRSIVELFAVAPLIIRVNDEADSEEDENWSKEIADDEDESEEIDDAMKKKMTKKENDIKMKKKKMKKMKNNELKMIWSLEKRKLCKPMTTTSSVRSHTLQNSVCSKKNRKAANRITKIQKQPTKKTSRKKQKASSTSILLSMKQKPAKIPPIRSILKKHKRRTTDQMSSKLISARAANLIKLYCKSNRHVAVSVKDKLLGNTRGCSAIDLPQLQSLCKIFSDVLAASSLQHSSKGQALPYDIDRPKEVKDFEKEAETDCLVANKNLLSDSKADLCRPTIVNSSNSSCSGTEKASFAVMVDLNRAIDTNDSECFIPATSTSSTSCVYNPNSRSTFVEKNPNSASEIHLKANSIALLKNPSFYDSSSSPSLIVYDKTNEEQFQSHANHNAYFCQQIEKHQSGGHCYPKASLDKRCCSMMASKQFKESLLTPDKCHGEIIGLPLNSQGEFIQFHSGAKFSEVYDRQNMDLSSNHGFSANRHEWNQKHCYNVKGKELLISCNSNLRSPCFHEYRNATISNNFYDREDICCKHNANYHFHPPVRSTMRLMGKNVVVGKISEDSSNFNNRRTYNNGENEAERQTQFSQPWIQGQHALNSTLGSSNGDLLELFDSGPNVHPMKILDTKLGYMKISQQPQRPSGIHNQSLYQGPSSATQSQFMYKMPLMQSATRPPHWLHSQKSQKTSGMNSMPSFSPPSVHPFETNDKRNTTALKKDRDKDKIYSNFPSFKSSMDTQMLLKKPIGFHERILSSVNRPLRGQLRSHPPAKTKETEHSIPKKKAPGVGSSKHENEFRSRPIKLIAGAKHILKPCHSGDEESCRLIHSTIFSPSTDVAGKLFDSEKKIANIYYF